MTTLDRISLIPDNDAKLANLQALAKSDAPDIVEIAAGRAEVGGRILNDIHLYRNDALRYERQVEQELLQILPLDVQRHAIVYRNLTEPREADVMIDDGQRLVVFEIKHLSKPVGAEVVLQVERMCFDFARHYGKSTGALIVSHSGFTHSADEVALLNRRVRLVQWAGPQDNDKLLRKLNEVRDYIRERNQPL